MLHLLLDDQRKAIELECAERLVERQPGLPQQSSDTALLTQDTFTLHHFGQIGFVGQVGGRRFQRQVAEVVGHA